MARIARLPVRLAYAAALLGSLAFGTTQAFAGTIWPTPPDPAYCGPDCEWRERMGCVCW